MKRIFSYIILSFVLVLSLNAQVDRSIRPEPGPAPTIQLGEFESFKTANGIEVIVVENRNVPVVSINLRLNIDPFLEGEAKGYVDFAGSLMREGTTNRSKQEIDETIDFIGGSLSTSATGMFASSLTRHKETLVELMADVLLNPTFPEEELQRRITQSRTGLQSTRTDANAIANNIAQAQVYGSDHPYGEIVTEETLDNINVDLLKEYYNTYVKPNVAYMIIVGDMDVEEAKALMEQYFSSWEPAEVPRHSYPTPQAPAQRRVAFGERSGSSQSVTSVTYPLYLPPGHEDAIKVSVMNNVYGGLFFSARLLQNIREDKGYTYGAYSILRNDPIVTRLYTVAEIRNEVTDSTITEKLYEMNRLRSEPVTEETLTIIINYMNGQFARALESPRTIANYAYNIKRYNLPEDYYATYLEKLAEVTIEDVNEMAQKYLLPENSVIVVAGNKEVVENLEKFSPTGTVEIFDPFGRPVSEAAKKPIPEGVTIETVLNKYIDAKGGRAKLESMKDLTVKMTASMMGTEISLTSYQKTPNMFRMETAMAGNVMGTQVFDGEKGMISQMGQKMEYTEGPEFEQMKMQAVMNMELQYKDFGIEKKLTGIETVDGEEAYRVEVRSPSGQETIEYYAVDSGFKIRTESEMGFAVISDYREVNGIKIPFRMMQQAGPQTMDFEVIEVKINSGLEDSKFAM